MSLRVDTLYVFINPPLWFRRLAKAYLDRELTPATRFRLDVRANRYHVITTDPTAYVFPGPTTYEIDPDSPEPPKGADVIVHVDNYDTARAVPYGKLLIYVPTFDYDIFVQQLEEVAKIAARFPNRLLVEFDKQLGVARLNYVLSLLAYRMKVTIRDVSYMNIVSYLEGRNIVYSEYGPPFQLTVYGAKKFICPHSIVYGVGIEPSFRLMNYSPCPAMSITADPYVYLLRKIYPDLERLLPAESSVGDNEGLDSQQHNEQVRQEGEKGG